MEANTTTKYLNLTTPFDNNTTKSSHADDVSGSGSDYSSGSGFGDNYYSEELVSN